MPDFGLNPLILAGACAVLGLCVGSFLNVVIHRLPAMISWDGDESSSEAPPNLVSPPSSCPRCGTRIRPWHNIPLVSYLLLGGRCASCSQPISRRYPAVELLGAGIAVGMLYLTDTPLAFAGGLIFSYSLLALLLIDFEHYLLPDLLTLPLLWVGLLLNTGQLYTTLDNAVFGAVAGYLTLWAVYHLFRLLTGKEGMGYGDFKLTAAIGAWLGWTMLPLVILAASTLGAVVGGIYLLVSSKGRDHPIPFGPFLAIAGWIAMFRGPDIVDRYLGFLGVR